MKACGKCGQPHGRLRGDGKTPASYCLKCHAAYMAATRPGHRELPQASRRKHNARAFARVYQRRGLLLPKPCERCGSAQAEKHHEDYGKPLQVTWLCRACHLAEHRQGEAPHAAS